MAQIVIDNISVHTSPKLTMQAIDDNFDELYAKDTALTTQIGLLGLRPEDYGAVGNGTTDDTAAVQACINAADAAKVSVMLSKFYKLTNKITVPDGLSILGTHRDSCGFKIYRADFNLSATGVLDLVVSDAYGARLEDFQITTDMDTTNTVRANLTVFPPLIRAVACPRFFLKNLRLNRAYIGIDATGNSGGAHITDCEIGAYHTGIKFNAPLDFIFIDNVELWPFGIATTASEAIYADGTTIGLDAVRVDGLSIGTLSTFWCKTNLDGCFGSIGTLNLDGKYSQLNITATTAKSEIAIGALYKTTDAADDWGISVSGTYTTNLSIGSAWMKNLVNITSATKQYALIYLNQANSDIVIGNLRADLVGATTRLVAVTAGHLMLSNTYLNTDTLTRTNAAIYVTSGEISISNLKASTNTTSSVLIHATLNLRHYLSGIIAPGWTLSLPTTNTLITLNDIDTNTFLVSTRSVHATKRYKLTAVFNTSGTATISSPPISDYTKYLSVVAFADYGTTYKVGIDGSKISIGNAAITITTGITAYSTLTCEVYVDVIVD